MSKTETDSTSGGSTGNSVDTSSSSTQTKNHGRNSTTTLHSISSTYLDNSTVKISIDYIKKISNICVVGYMHYIHPLVWQLLVLEAQVVTTITAAIWHILLVVWEHILSPFLYNTILPNLHTLYTTQLLPWYYTYIYPFYQAHAEVIVNKTIIYILTTWETHYEVWFDRNILDIYDFIIGRMHYIAYFTMQFITSDDIFGNLHSIFVYLRDFIPNLIEQLMTIPALQEQFGINCELYMNILVYTIIILFIYIIRRILLGIAAFILLLVLSPVLLVLYCLVTPFMGKKKSSKKSSKGSSSGSGYNKGQRSSTTAVAGTGTGLVRGEGLVGAPPRHNKNVTINLPVSMNMNTTQQQQPPLQHQQQQQLQHASSYPPPTQSSQHNYGNRNYSTNTTTTTNNSSNNTGSSNNNINPFPPALHHHQQQWSEDFEP